MNVLTDPSAERAVLAGIFQYGADCLFDVVDIISEKTFTIDSNEIIYKCLKTLIEEDNNVKLDISSIYSAANRLDLGYWFNKNDEVKHLQSITLMPIQKNNVRKMAAVIRKLEIARLLHKQLGDAQGNLMEIRGTEPISAILGIGESAVFDFSNLINNQDQDSPESLINDLAEYLEYLADNPIKHAGLSTGYSGWDESMGGGMRAGVTVLGARNKVGKSTVGVNVAVNVFSKSVLPVLYLDTEMMKRGQQHRLAALLTETDVNTIETGQFAQSSFQKNKILNIVKQVQKVKSKLDYKNVAGRPFEDILSIARRWLIKEVGMNPDGTAKPCLIIFDYLKVMNTEGMGGHLQEYQMLGFMLTALQNFGLRYNVPILTFVQLNRDGISKEDSSVISGSDRIGWFCNSFSILKPKSPEEIAEDGIQYGNRKLQSVLERYGPGMERYINLNFTGKYAKIVEVIKPKNQNFQTKTTDSDDDDTQSFD